jgi:hypothetical protein
MFVEKVKTGHTDVHQQQPRMYVRKKSQRANAEQAGGVEKQ